MKNVNSIELFQGHEPLENVCKETFGRGIQLILSVLTRKAGEEFQDPLKIDSYYFLLQDLPEKHFLNGVVELMKNWSNVHFFPAPKDIREAVLLESRCGYSESDYKLYKEISSTIKEIKFIDNKK